MRLSADKADPGFDLLKSMHAKVFLDGIEQKYCITADEELGEIICADVGPDGRVRPDGVNIARVTRRGIVRIEIPE